MDCTNLARVISLERKHVRRRIKVVLELDRNPEVVRQSRVSFVWRDVLGQLIVGILPLDGILSGSPGMTCAELETTHLSVLAGQKLDIAINDKHGCGGL